MTVSYSWLRLWPELIGGKQDMMTTWVGKLPGRFVADRGKQDMMTVQNWSDWRWAKHHFDFWQTGYGDCTKLISLFALALHEADRTIILLREILPWVLLWPELIGACATSHMIFRSYGLLWLWSERIRSNREHVLKSFDHLWVKRWWYFPLQVGELPRSGSDQNWT